MADYVFHVLHNARPEYEMDVLAILQDNQEPTYGNILSEGESLGLTIGSQVKTERMLKDILQPLRDLGLVERRQIKLTQLGHVWAQIAYNNPYLFPEIFHYLYYSIWNPKQEAQKCFSWSYRTLCNHLWGQGTVALDKKMLASFISVEANQRFQIRSVSFSQNSVQGVTVWLEALSPSVIRFGDDLSEEVFSRRLFCPPELFALGVDFVYQTQEIDYGVNLLLNDERRDAICQVCLLEPTSFDRVLEYAVAQFDYLEQGTGGGWGRYLTLRRAPRLEDFLT